MANPVTSAELAEPTEDGFVSRPFHGMIAAPTVTESIRLALLVCAGRIPHPDFPGKRSK